MALTVELVVNRIILKLLVITKSLGKVCYHSIVVRGIIYNKISKILLNSVL